MPFRFAPVSFDLEAGESLSLMTFLGVTDSDSPTGLADAIALAGDLNSDLVTLGSNGFLAGLSPAQVAGINNYAIPEPATLALLGVGGLALLRRRRR